MSTGLDLLAHESAAALRAEIDRTVDTDAALRALLDEDHRTVGRAPQPRRRRSALVVALAAAAVLATGVVIVATSGEDEPRPPADSVVDTTSAATVPGPALQTTTSVDPSAASRPLSIDVSGPFDVEGRVTEPSDVELVPPLDERVPPLRVWPLDDLTMGLELEVECDGCAPRAPFAVVDSVGRVVVAENAMSRFRVIRPDGGTFVEYPVGMMVTGMAIGPGNVLYVSYEAAGQPRSYRANNQFVAYRTSEMERGVLTPLRYETIVGPTVAMYVTGESVVRQPACGPTASECPQDGFPLVEGSARSRPSAVGTTSGSPLRVAGTTATHVVLRGEVVGDPPIDVAVVVAADGSYEVLALPPSVHNLAWTVDERGIVAVDVDDAAGTWRVIRIPIEE